MKNFIYNFIALLIAIGLVAIEGIISIGMVLAPLAVLVFLFGG